MTDELEKKLNELLGLKKKLEEATDEKKKTVAAFVWKQYKKEAKSSFIRLAVVLIVGLALLAIAEAAIFKMKAVSIDPMSLVLLGALILAAGKVGWLIRQAKLSLMLEMKQLEMRLTELLQK